jgi:hypothetical protein
MAGPKWTSTELEIVLRYDSLHQPPHRSLCSALERKSGTHRTLSSVRSKLSELKQNAALYDSGRKIWINEGVRYWIEELQDTEET